jgi:hypothetical protein
MKNLLLFFTCLSVMLQINAQETDTTKGAWDFSAYGDMYFSYDFSEPNDNERHHFLYNYKRHNEFNVNLVLLHANYKYKGLDFNMGLSSGTFPHYNMAHELPLLRMIYEANIKYNFTKKWEFTMGMFPSHLGFEGFKSANNDVLTHSIVSENTPYYVTGAKLGYTPFDKLKINALITNGWQIITETPANTNKGVGLQLEYDPTDNIHFNYSNIYSNEAPDTAAVWILYHNIYGIFNITDKIRITAGFDFGNGDDKTDTLKPAKSVMLGTLIARYQFHKKWALAARGEFYNDPDGLIISTPAPHPFEVVCFSGNLDYAPNKNILFRIEGRGFTSNEPIFREDRDNPKAPDFIKYVNQNLAVTFAVQIKFD